MNRNLALWIIIGLFLVAIFNLLQSPPTQKQQVSIDYSTLMQNAKEGSIQEVLIRGNMVTGQLKDGKNFSAVIPPNDPNLLKSLTESNARIKFAASEEDVPGFFQVILSWLPMILLIGVWIYFMRQMQSGGNKAMGFGKSRARLMDDKASRVTFYPRSSKPASRRSLT